MGVLQKEFDRISNELFKDDSLRVMLVRSAIEAKGFELNEGHVQSLTDSIKDKSDQDEMQIELEGLSADISITPEDLKAALTALENDIESHTEQLILAALEELPPEILGSLYDDLPKALRHRRGLETQFRDRLHGRWKEGLDRLEMLLMIAQEAGDIYIEDLKEDGSEEEEESPSDGRMLEALVALHVRACRIASEVLCLLQGGFADGANARWRSVHEVAVTAMFLVEQGGNIADRYIDHGAIERLRAAEKYQEHCQTLGFEPYTTEEMNDFATAADAMIHKYGRAFRGDYGWASEALGTTNATFTQVEAALDMSHWRPHFKMACQSVHAGAQALEFCLSVPEGASGMLLAGASDAGLADPGHLTAISLVLASVPLFTFNPNVDSLIACKCMLQLCDDIGEALIAAHNGLEEEITSSVCLKEAQPNPKLSTFMRTIVKWTKSIWNR